ncbi:MAG: hypothetical protein R2794_05435 [Chitinophagales bacterium]
MIVRKVKTILGLVLSLLLLVSSSGISLFSHLCLMEGDQELSITHMEGCCADMQPVPGTVWENRCCDDEAQLLALDMNAPVMRHLIIAAPDLYTEIPQSLDADPDISGRAKAIEISLPPPKTGRDILTDNSILRI